MGTDGTGEGTQVPRLTDMQAAFVRHYLANGGNASAAAREAGYAHGSAGRKLIQRGVIQREIQRVRGTAATRDAARTVGALARVSGERIVNELAETAFAQPDDAPTHSEKIRALDILAKVTGLYNDNPVFVSVQNYVKQLSPEKRRELLVDRGRLIELIEGQGYTVEAS